LGTSELCIQGTAVTKYIIEVQGLFLQCIATDLNYAEKENSIICKLGRKKKKGGGLLWIMDHSSFKQSLSPGRSKN